MTDRLAQELDEDTVLAIAAGLIGIVVGGQIQTDATWKKVAVRATGAAAFFVIVLFAKPIS